MKRIVSLLLTLALLLSLCAAASADEPALRVTAMKGPTGMGMVQLMRACEEGGELAGQNWQIDIKSAIDEVTPLLVRGEVDIAAIPANLASVLWNNTQGEIQVLAVNTLGVLYIVENGETVQTAEDLRGRTIYASGQGATPEYALNYILKGKGLEPGQDVTIEWKSEHAECLAALLADEDGIALLPQPFVTTAQMQNETVRVALDLNVLWDELQSGAENPSALLTGVLVVRKAYAEANPETVAAFMDAYAASVAFAQTDIDAAAELIAAYEIVPKAAIARKALPACNIVCIEGEEMKAKLSGYLAVLFEANPKSVGGQLPDEAFYYMR
ncbi:MAG: ABC transporter substrate-binding protein [Clostridia bacterium]|nr:ABC transporter substrate-binding protein [Clostridia bacterium]